MEKCNICQQTISERESSVETICGHKFHQACRKLWVEQNHTTCSECKAPLKKTEIASKSKASQMELRNKDKRNQGDASTSQQVQQQELLQQKESLKQQQQELQHQREIFKQQQQQQQHELQQQKELLLQQQKQQQHELQQQKELLIQQQKQQQPEIPREQPTLRNNSTAGVDDDQRIKNMVTSIITARQASLVNDLENSLSQRLERQIERSLSNLIQQLNLNTNANNRASPLDNMTTMEDEVPRQNIPNNDTPLNRSQFARRIESMQLSEVSSGNNSSHIARLITSWNIRFDGSPKLSVDSFIHRLESQVIDTLNGNFNLLCENIQSLLTDAAKDWYWNYRRTVRRVTWPSFCEALRLSFDEHKTDTEIKETMRNRKQGPSESFDDYRNAIYKLTERLSAQISEIELVEMMQRGLRPRIRQQLLYMPISSVAELRRLCLKGEYLTNEIDKNLPDMVRKPFSRHRVEELGLNLDHTDAMAYQAVEIEEVKLANLTCWNCKENGHRYYDCLKERTIFCYGCGEKDSYKPTCNKCNPGNFLKSETRNTRPRYDQK